MEIQERGSGKIYALATNASVPEWLSERSRRNLAKRDSQFRRRITLLQDLEMPVASTKVRQSPDGKFIIVGGTYSPRIRCYELAEMSMKFERYLDSEVVDLLILSEDYGKLAILGDDRTVSFHAPYGSHEKVRLPTFGRAMAYEKTTCDLLVASSGTRARVGVDRSAAGEVYRFNLDEGRFSRPYLFSPAPRAGGEGGGPRVAGGCCIAVSPAHPLAAVGAEDGTVRFWDGRSPPGSGPDDACLAPFLNLDVASATSGYGFFDVNSDGGFPGEVTSVCFDTTGVRMCAGTRGGNIALYDMRSSKPLFVKEHQYGLPIHTVQFHSGSGTVLSSDSKLVKIWNAMGTAHNDSSSARGRDWDSSYRDIDHSVDNHGLGGPLGSTVVNVEGTADFSHFITCGQSNGLLLCCGEQPKVQSFYCPVLGTAPRWCSFLDNITEELEEKDGSLDKSSTVGDPGSMQMETIYEDYKFLTRTEIDQLGIHNLVGTPLLRGYMHGFFIHIGLYNRVCAVARPFEYDQYRKQKIRERMEEKRASRIAPKVGGAQKADTKVNLVLARRLQAKSIDRTKAGKAAKALVEDARFGGLFSNPDFEIDEEAEDFKLRNPSGIAGKKIDKDTDSDQEDEEDANGQHGQGRGEENWLIRTADEEGGERWGNGRGVVDSGGDHSDTDSDDDGFQGGKVCGDAYESLKSRLSSKAKKKNKANKKSARRRKSRNVMYEGGADAVDIGLGDITAENKAEKRKKEQSLSVEERLQLQSERLDFFGKTKHLRVTSQGTTKEVTFVPKSGKKARIQEKMTRGDEAGGKDDRMGRSRRSVKELGFKTPFKHHIS